MQVLEAALAFAITMLVLSLICSSFVEIIHRMLLMREAGLKYMLGQIFDQVLVKYVKPWAEAVAAKYPDFPGKKHADDIYAAARESFVQRMSANRVPMGVPPNAPPTSSSDAPHNNESWRVGLLGGRELTSLTASEFMERLGSMDVGQELRKAASETGAEAAAAVDAVLTDIAQKFEAFGKEAATYFEGRARLLSVCVAIVLAFAIRVDAIELLSTFLHDPNARNNVIEQTKAVTAQYKAANEAAQNLQKVSSAAPVETEEAKKQVEAVLKDLQTTVDSTKATVKQYADLGLPIGWSKENATLNPWKATCKLADGTVRLLGSNETCIPSDQKVQHEADQKAQQAAQKALQAEQKAKQATGQQAKSGAEQPSTQPQRNYFYGESGAVGWEATVKLALSLLLGGVLIGLGGPFWYDVVNGLTNIRSIAKDISGTGQPKAAPAVTAPLVAPEDAPDRPQPTTPVGAFNVSLAATPRPSP